MFFLLISDDFERSEPVVKKLSNWVPPKSIALSDYSESSDQGALFLLVDIDLSDRKSIDQFRNMVQSSSSKKDKIFVTSGKSQTEIHQANALGATSTLPTSFKKPDVLKILRRYATLTKKNNCQIIPEKTTQAIEDIGALNDSFCQAISSNRPLPKTQVISSGNLIAECLNESSIGSWLEAVKQHDSYTYRHSMIVSGVAVAFAMQLGMRNADVQRIATGALMHDIGKVHIPLKILDKPGKLSPSERAEINKHPGYGFEILRKDSQFDDEVLDIALHHHELLDGRGYPEGLAGDQISDLVRIITVVDIFSALIDKRPYKETIPADEAYQILLDMDGKLDMDILKAFKPTALAVQSSTQDTPTHQAMAS
jgi:putative nucleotidyltransferase with HDIG domain